MEAMKENINGSDTGRWFNHTPSSGEDISPPTL